MRTRSRAWPVVVVIGVAASWALSAGAFAAPAAGTAAATAKAAANAGTAADATPVYLDPHYSPQERAADLVSRLTLQEKAAQMNSSQAAAIPRLGIAAYGWWNEAAHGVAREQTNNGGNPPVLTDTTSYPVDLSMGSTWNPALMYKEAGMISDEAREVVRGNSLDLSFYSPTVNLARDPRWGRNDETFGEDPLLTASIASQYVDGMEGKTPAGAMSPASGGYLKTLPTIKHFAANNSEGNRLTGSSDMDERTLREYYTAQFRDLVKTSGPAAIMSSYNEINGVPAAANVHLIDELARETFGFQGYFTSDCDAVYEIQAGHHWQPPGASAPLDAVGRTAYANSAGEDLDCNQGYHDGSNYANAIPTAVAQGIRTQTGVYNENDVDTSLVRLFTARIRTGEFDDEATVPWVAAARARLAPGTWVNSDANAAVTQTPARLAMARQAGDQSIVLLKNSPVQGADGAASSLLPLKVPATGAFKVAVYGTYANPSSMYLGGYSSNQGPAGVANEVNGYQGLKSAIQRIDPQATVDYYPGVTPAAPGTPASVDAAAVKAAAGYNAVIVYAGTDASTADESKDRTSLALPGAQASLISQVAAANPRTVVYMETLGQVDVGSFADQVPAMLWSSYNGQRKGESLADVVLGAYNPSGRLPFTWYADVNKLPAIGDYTIRPTATDSGRTYMYYSGPVTYPFGYGLSYTGFRFSHLQVDSRHLTADGTLRIGAQVTNTGPAAGDEVAQIYVTTPDAPAALQRPLKRLEGFTKVHLRPHRTTHVTFTVHVPDLAFFSDQANRYQVDDGRYGIQLATSSADTDVQAQTFVHVTGALTPTPATLTARPAAAGDSAQGISQRVFFPAGTTVDPQLTVAMNDDSLYGYINAGSNTPLPPGMRVHYTSNRPSVVAATASDTLRTTGPGVATVTATVDYHGAHASTQFVVDVR
ncbi:glycoside hydrolase family 3 C-terminal domain-containing protein [Actinacidiphila acididurans]|uniref:Glycoside hydrolase family 3 C-terminal domain-containing protein n=1 Tax=Actinacidiphila acididurans TaxID=2784346 RepID=A0ABS2TT19_9ACTN|nr:glycoside hydrolase family 3 C-terminal domain-containing protein [Actinacidiphila acididurans]MBM9506490.1 glycoside hydrolase family 3 C-terminal domain-containing protein [Actinacidiphila acididurans]